MRKLIVMKTQKSKIEKPFSEMSFDERTAFYAASPFFKKKKEDAIAFLKKHPLPKRILDR
ncbi:hypothetical protein D3C87_1834800 [compost metagenome]